MPLLVMCNMKFYNVGKVRNMHYYSTNVEIQDMDERKMHWSCIHVAFQKYLVRFCRPRASHALSIVQVERPTNAVPKNCPHLSKKRLDLLLHVLLALSVRELLLLVLERLCLPVVLALLLAGVLVLLEWVLADLLVGVLVELLKTVGLNLVVGVAAELGLVALLIVVGEGLHVLGNVATEDVLAEGFGVQLLGLHVVTGETLLGVGNVETTVGCTLHRAEDTGTGAGARKTNIEVRLEWAAGLAIDFGGLGDGELAVGLLDTLECLVKLELAECAAGEQQTGAVGSGPVGETVGDTVALELVGVGGAEDFVASELRGDDLADDVLVGEANDQAVLGGVVLVLKSEVGVSWGPSLAEFTWYLPWPGRSNACGHSSRSYPRDGERTSPGIG